MTGTSPFPTERQCSVMAWPVAFMIRTDDIGRVRLSKS